MSYTAAYRTRGAVMSTDCVLSNVVSAKWPCDVRSVFDKSARGRDVRSVFAKSARGRDVRSYIEVNVVYAIVSSVMWFLQHIDRAWERRLVLRCLCRFHVTLCTKLSHIVLPQSPTDSRVVSRGEASGLRSPCLIVYRSRHLEESPV